MTGAASCSLLSAEVCVLGRRRGGGGGRKLEQIEGGGRKGKAGFRLLIQISFKPSFPTPCPSVTPLTPPPAAPARPGPALSPLLPPLLSPLLSPPSTHHLPPQGWNTGELTGEERVKEKGWDAFPLVCACARACVCVCWG